MSQDQARLWTPNFVLVSLVNFQLVLVFYLLVIVIVLVMNISARRTAQKEDRL